MSQMSLDPKGLPPHPLLSDRYRIPMEQVVSEYYQRKWSVNEFRDIAEFSSHPSAILSDRTFPVFAKLSEAANGLDQFEVERAGLQLLSERAGVLIPSLNLTIPEFKPCLLHGDASQNNFITTAKGVMVIDPAVYYGNPEIDLAYIDYFQQVPGDVFIGYQEVLNIDPGFAERRDAWRISGYLAAIEVEGMVHLHRLTGALQKYLK